MGSSGRHLASAPLAEREFSPQVPEWAAKVRGDLAARGVANAELLSFAPDVAKVRGAPSRPGSWANFSVLLPRSHRRAWASLHI